VPNDRTQFRYLKKRKRWQRLDTKQLVTKAEMARIQLMESSRPNSDSPQDYGYTFNLNRHPESDIYDAIERIVGMGERGVDITKDPVLNQAAERFNHLLAFLDQDNMTGAMPYRLQSRGENNQWLTAAETNIYQNPPQPIPTGIRSAMTLAEFYTNTQGDVAQTIESPIDLSISDLVINVPKDKKIEQKLKDLYGPEKLNMKYILYQIMYNVGIFGSAYPMEVPDDPERPNEIVQIIPLPPKFMWVGYHMVNGMLSQQKAMAGSPFMPSPYAIRPWDNSPNWTQELAEKMFMPMTYNAFASGFNEQIVQGWGLPVDPYYLHPVRSKALHWNRYPQPPIAKAFRSISTRSIYQEMRRSLLEGFKNQLWLFILGTKDAMPSPQEMMALKSAVDGLSGNRTGNLVWRYGLDVQVKAPTPLQDAISNEVSQAFKIEIFSDIGCNIRLTTGNKVSMPGSGAGDSGVEVDLSIWLTRLEFIRKNIMEWEYLFRMRQADRWDREGGGTGHAAREALQDPDAVKFSRSLLDISEEIKQIVLPLYTVGLTSPQTALRHADENYETELQNKKDYQPNQSLFMPPPSFNQMASNSSGESKTTPSNSSGRPPDSINPNKMTAFDPTRLTAAFNDSDTKRLYYAAILAILTEDLWNENDVDKFIADLKAANSEWLSKISAEAYQAAGGVGNVEPNIARLSANYVNSYADAFGDRLRGMLSNEEPIATENVRRNTMLYPQEGFRAAAVNATNQVMKERGASHWRRVLHPELSKRGPCSDCVADSQVLHSMDEPFAVMHPYDVCGTQDVGLQYFTGGIPSVEVPTPNSGNELAQQLFGNKSSGKTRRKRV